MRKKMVILPRIYNAGGDLSKQWFVEYSIRDPRNDKMMRKRESGSINKQGTLQSRQKAAEKLRAELTRKLKNGWSPLEEDTAVIYEDHLQYRQIADMYVAKRRSNRTAYYFSNLFIKSIAPSLSEATVSTYSSKIRTFNFFLIREGAQENDIASIDNSLILRFFDFLIEQRKLSGNSIRKYRQILTAMFDYAIQSKALKENPVYNTPECNRINDCAPRPVNRMDIEIFHAEIERSDPQLWMAIEFQFYCYLRPGKELRLLKIGDIDFARGIILLNRDNFKTRRENVKEIPNHFLRKMREHYDLSRYPRELYVFGKNGCPGVECLGKNNLRFRFNRFRDALKMPDTYKFYSWKHTGGVMAAESGVSINEISDQMGHISLSTTSAYLKAKGGRRLDTIRYNYPVI